MADTGVQMAVEAWSQMTDEQKRKYSEDFKQNHTIEELDADGDVDVVNDDGAGAGAGKRKCGSSQCIRLEHADDASRITAADRWPVKDFWL